MDFKFSSNIKTAKEEATRLKREIRQRTVGYITAGFGFIAGLAWNDAIRSLIEYFFPLSRDTIMVKFIYAVIITLILVIVTIYIIRFLQPQDSDK